MTSKKQSAHSRREDRRIRALLGLTDDTLGNSLNNLSSTTNSDISNINTILTNLTQQSNSTNNYLNFHMDSNNAAGFEARIQALEAGGGGGGGGIDPSNPDVRIVYEDFLYLYNGSEYGNVSPYVADSLGGFAQGMILNPGEYVRFRPGNNEIDHPGVLRITWETGNGITADWGPGFFGVNETANVIRWADISRITIILKTPSYTISEGALGDVYDFVWGLSADLTNPTTSDGIFFYSNLTNWQAKARSGITTTTQGSIAYAANTWYRLDIKRTATDDVEFYIDDVLLTTIAVANLPTTIDLNLGFALNFDLFETPENLPQAFIDFIGVKLGPPETGGALPEDVTVAGTANEVEVNFASNVYTIGLPNSITVADTITTDQLAFSTVPSTSLGIAKLQWDNDYETLRLGMDVNINAPINQCIYKKVRNSSNTTPINLGEVVYINGSQGDTVLRVGLASASTEATAATTIGIAAETIANNGTGMVILQGLLTGLNTNAYTAGDLVWLSTTAGGWTTTRPQAPNHGVFLGWIVKSAGAPDGSIYVKVANGQELDELHDVYINKQTISNFDTLRWNTANLRFETVSGEHAFNLVQNRLVGRAVTAGTGPIQPITLGPGLKLTTGGQLETIGLVGDSIILSAGLGLTGGGDLTANRTFAVDFATSGTSSATQAVRADDSRLSNARTPTAHTHPLSDLTQSSASLNQVPQWNGTSWVPVTLAGGSPGGSTGEVQYNNAGAFGGATNVKINSNNLELVKPSSEPTTSPVDSVVMYTKSIGQRDLPAFVDSTGWSTNLQTCIARNKFNWINFNGGVTTTPVTLGIVYSATAVGTGNTTAGAVALTTTSLLGGSRRQSFLTANTAGNAAGWKASVAQCWRGNASKRGGFFCVWKFGIGDAAFDINGTLFVGLNDSTGVPDATSITNPITTVNNTMRNQVGLVLAGGSSTYTIAYRNGVSAATTISLTGFTANNTDIVEFCLYAAPNDTTIHYYLKIYSNGGADQETSGNIGTSNIPVNTTQFVPHCWRGRTSTATSAVAVHCHSFSIEQPH